MLAALEHDALDWLADHGLTSPPAERTRFRGNDAVRIEARTAPPDNRRLTLTLFCKGARRFELRCLSPVAAPATPCRHALPALAFDEPPDDPKDAVRVLHLRDEKLGIAFDAPDDSWLAIGPRVAGDWVEWRWAIRGETSNCRVIAARRSAG